MSGVFETNLVTYLNGVTPITDLIEQRVYPWPCPQNPTFPLLTYHLIADEPDRSLTSGSTGLIYREYQFDCFSKDKLETYQLACEVQKALLGYKGAMGTSAVGNIWQRSGLDLYEGEDEVSRRVLRLGMWICEDPISNIQGG